MFCILGIDMNQIVEMDRTGYELVAWKPTTEDWVKNRKYIAVLKENGCHWIESKKGEGMSKCKTKETDKQLVFSFIYFIGFDFDDTQGMFLVFEKEGRQTGLLINDCMFYKNKKPPVLEEILNKLKQNQI